MDFQTRAHPESTELVHSPTPLFDVALKGIESGYRHCLRALSTDLAQYHTLCNTYDFLCVDVLGGATIDDIKSELKVAKQEKELCGELMLVYLIFEQSRNAAFRLLYLILLGECKDKVKDSVKIFCAVKFVVSDHENFILKMRKIIRAAYEDRFVSSEKQRASLDRSERTDPANLGAEYYSDESTEWWSPYSYSDYDDSSCGIGGTEINWDDEFDL